MANHFKEIAFDTFSWIDIQSATDEQAKHIIQKHKLNHLLVRDSMEPGHLPKIEVYPEYTFMILRAYTASDIENVTTVQELSDKVAFFIMDKMLITIHRTSFDFIQQLLSNHSSDTTQYQLILMLAAQTVQSYEQPANKQADQIDIVENTIFLKDLNKISLEELYFQKAEARISKKVLQLTQSVVNQLRVPTDNMPALQDVKDMLVKLILEYEESLEDINNLTNTYLSISAQRSNNVMKLLTIFSAFFLPLTFLVGVYGMNFEYMPELKWRYGYLFVVILMVAFVTVILIWFKRRKIM